MQHLKKQNSQLVKMCKRKNALPKTMKREIPLYVKKCKKMQKCEQVL